MKTINELIKYYEIELEGLTVEIKHNEERKFNDGVQFNKGERIRVREILECLKNLPNEPKTVSNNEQAGECFLSLTCTHCGQTFKDRLDAEGHRCRLRKHD